MFKDVNTSAKKAKASWLAFASSYPKQLFSKWFHLRPTSKGVTIVTTHRERAMRGISVSNIKLNEALYNINACLTEDTIEWDKIESKLGKFFEKGRLINKEFPIQACIINAMNGYSENDRISSIKNVIGVDKLIFIASELVLKEKDLAGALKIDIVAHDGAEKVFFFEIKSPENKKDDPVRQVKKYLSYYGKRGDGNSHFEELMRNYPINSVDSIKDYIGCVVTDFEHIDGRGFSPVSLQ